MITIHNKDVITGLSALGHEIYGMDEGTSFGIPVYKFKFIYNHPRVYDSNLNVYLERVGVNGEHALYVMKFRSVTEILIKKNSISTPIKMASLLRKVLSKLETYLNSNI